MHPASEQDREAAYALLADLKQAYPTLEQIWADAGYAGELVDWCANELGIRLEIVRRKDGDQGFVVQARRWVVERTFGWLGRCRRLSKDYEQYEESSEAWIYLALIRLLVRRLCPTPGRKAYAAI